MTLRTPRSSAATRAPWWATALPHREVQRHRGSPVCPVRRPDGAVYSVRVAAASAFADLEWGARGWVCASGGAVPPGPILG